MPSQRASIAIAQDHTAPTWNLKSKLGGESKVLAHGGGRCAIQGLAAGTGSGGEFLE